MVKLVTAVCVLIGFQVTVAQQANPLHASRIQGAIEVDGRLEEDAWKRAEVFNNFIQGTPNIGAAPTEKTDIRILYNDEFLYISVMAYDSLPSRIIATGLERDVYYFSDDHICVTLDTYNDKWQGILFSTNALSARFDEEVLSNGNSFNAAYNTFWDVRSERNDHGYSAEFRIPFSSLRFQKSDEVVMGIKILRYIKHRNEFDIFPISDVTVGNAVWRVNNAQEIVFKDLKAKKPFYVIPYAKVDYHDSKILSSDGSQVVHTSKILNRNHFSSSSGLDKVISNLGFDIKYGLSKNFTLDATVNTDFAQAETDNRILNFTRFAINLPEKRNFFLESKDYLGFSTGSGYLLFNSRTIGIESGSIVPIIGGVRVTGKANGLQLGFLDIQTNGINDLQIAPQHFSVLRWRKEVWGNGSFIGGIFTNRLSTDGNAFNNQAVAVDVVKRFKDNKWMAGLNYGVTNDKSANGFFDQSSMANAVLFRTVALGYNHSTSVEYAERKFKPLIGFFPDSAYVLTNISNGYIWKWKNSAKRNLFWFTHFYNHKYRTINNTHESVSSELEVGTSYNNGITIIAAPLGGREYLPYDWNFRNDITIPMGYYKYGGVRFRHDSKQTNRLNYFITAQWSGFYGGTRLSTVINGYYAINRNFRVTYKYEFNSFEFPRYFSLTGNSHLNSNLLAIGFAFTQSIYFSAKALVQYDDLTKTVGGNFRIRINPKEGTDLFIVYNPRLNTAFPMPEGRSHSTLDQQTIIVKFSKAFSL